MLVAERPPGLAEKKAEGSGRYPSMALNSPGRPLRLIVTDVASFFALPLTVPQHERLSKEKKGTVLKEMCEARLPFVC
jgi:hypothetical protein